MKWERSTDKLKCIKCKYYDYHRYICAIKKQPNNCNE